MDESGISEDEDEQVRKTLSYPTVLLILCLNFECFIFEVQEIGINEDGEEGIASSEEGDMDEEEEDSSGKNSDDKTNPYDYWLIPEGKNYEQESCNLDTLTFD
jgi:hypothetical protein